MNAVNINSALSKAEVAPPDECKTVIAVNYRFTDII